MTAASAFALGLGSLVGYWPLGEASGDALDGSTNSNNGTVTLGAGVRDAAALDVGGDGSIEFDGADTRVAISDDSAISDIFDAGGSLVFMFNADSDGEGGTGQVVEKRNNWVLRVQDESSSKLRLRFHVDFDSTDGEWDTAVDVPINTTIIGVLTYDADAITNNPILYLWDGSAFTIRTVDDGLTESTAPMGTRVADASSFLQFGNDVFSAKTFDGHIDEVMLFSDILTEATARELIRLALEGIVGGGAELPPGWGGPAAPPRGTGPPGGAASGAPLGTAPIYGGIGIAVRARQLADAVCGGVTVRARGQQSVAFSLVQLLRCLQGRPPPRAPQSVEASLNAIFGELGITRRTNVTLAQELDIIAAHLP